MFYARVSFVIGRLMSRGESKTERNAVPVKELLQVRRSG